MQANKFHIGVCSRDRAHFIEKRMGIWKYINPFNPPEFVSLCIREKEKEEYSMFKGETILVPNKFGLAEKRLFYFENSPVKDVEHLLLIDDDVVLYYRDETLSSKYRCQIDKFRDGDHFNRLVLETLALCTEEFPMVGISHKQGSSTNRYMFEKNCPIFRWWCCHLPTIKEHGVSIANWNQPFMTDRYMQLDILNKGKSTLTNNRFAVDDLGTNYRGGCSNTRTVILQSTCAKEMQKKFPNYISLKIKDNGYWKERRIDCNINWKKFLQENEQVYLNSNIGLQRIDDYIKSHEKINWSGKNA